VFLRGARIFYAHTVLQRQSGLGYLSAWAGKSFSAVQAKNEFFERLGRELKPEKEDRLRGLTGAVAPGDIIAKIK
jgi:hypothetical protein